MNKTILWVIIVVIVLAGIWYFFFRGGQTADETATGVNEAPALDGGILEEEASALEVEAGAEAQVQ